MHIFEEIEEVARSPPENCQILDFGGAVIVCSLLINGAFEILITSFDFPELENPLSRPRGVAL